MRVKNIRRIFAPVTATLPTLSEIKTRLDRLEKYNRLIKELSGDDELNDKLSLIAHGFDPSLVEDQFAFPVSSNYLCTLRAKPEN